MFFCFFTLIQGVKLQKIKKMYEIFPKIIIFAV